jgi:hypothetical protein
MVLGISGNAELRRQLEARDEARRRGRTRLRETMAANRADLELQRQAEGAISALLAPAHGVARVELGVWECTKSPIGFCYYDADNDLYWDECLVCGAPHERK